MVCIAAHLDMIRNEYSTAEAAGNAADEVDDTGTKPTEQLFHVTHEQQLKDDTQQQLQNSSEHQHVTMMYGKRRKQTITRNLSSNMTCSPMPTAVVQRMVTAAMRL